MVHEQSSMDQMASSGHGEPEVRKGPWTMEEDYILVSYIAEHGEGVWNNLARSAGLNRTGKSCRLRWLNYLKPDVRRGNITLEEEMLIIDLHSRWGNRWSKIAKHLPGRTDNEIKNYWRTRIQKKMKYSAPLDYQNAAVANHEHRAAASQTSSMEDGTEQLRCTGHDTADHSMVDLEALAQEFTFDAGDNFWNVEAFWSTMPMLNSN